MINTSNVARPTNMALAFLNVAVPCLQASGARAPWVARRVALNAERELGVVHEKRINLHLQHKTAEEFKRKGLIA